MCCRFLAMPTATMWLDRRWYMIEQTVFETQISEINKSLECPNSQRSQWVSVSLRVFLLERNLMSLPRWSNIFCSTVHCKVSCALLWRSLAKKGYSGGQNGGQWWNLLVALVVLSLWGKFLFSWCLWQYSYSFSALSCFNLTGCELHWRSILPT